jgi:hypothetical protein
MDCDRIAAFLSTCTSQNFQRSLRFNPHATLVKCGFNPGEASQLAGAVLAFQGLGGNEKLRFSYVFQSISHPNVSKKSGATDDWSTGH